MQAPLIDGMLSFAGGMNGLLDPRFLGAAQSSFLQNFFVRGGIPRTRPGLNKIAELPSGEVHGVCRYSLNSGDYLVIHVGVSVYGFYCDTGALVQIPGLVVADAPSFMFQADRWLVFNSPDSAPVIIEEGATAGTLAVADVDVSMVPGYFGLYAHSRIHYVPAKVPLLVPDPEAFPDATPTLSDEDGRACFVSTDVKDLEDPTFVFRMSEHRVLNEGGGMALPQEIGFITGFGALRNTSTGTGVGALVVFGREGVSAFDVGSARSQWKDVGISQVLFFGSSTLSWRSVINANGDLLYIDSYGHLRTVKYSAKERTEALVSLSLSGDLGSWVTADGAAAASTAFCDNRVYATCRGNSAFFSLDLAVATKLNEADTPAFDGFHCGVAVHQIVNARKLSVMMPYVVGSSQGISAVYLLDAESLTDSGTPIESILVTKALSFESAVDMKRLNHVDLALTAYRDTEVEVLYRPVGYDKWATLGTKLVQVTDSPRYVRQLRFSVDFQDVECNVYTGEPLSVSDYFLVAVKLTGNAALWMIRARADLIGTEPPPCELPGPYTGIDAGQLLGELTYAL